MTPVLEAAEPESIAPAPMDTAPASLRTEPSLERKGQTSQTAVALRPIQQQKAKMAQIFADEMVSAVHPVLRREALKEISRILDFG